jgi:hypothetical protein
VVVDAKRALGRRTVSGRRETLGWVAVGACALILLAGVVAYFQSTADTGPPPTPSTAPPATSGPAVMPGGTLDLAAKRVAVEFLSLGLARTHLARAWDLATPDFRSSVTRKQWLRGELPFAPFPVRDLESARFHVVGTAPDKILLELFLVPELKSGYVPTRFEMTLVRKGAKGPWRVSYFLPYAPPGIYKEPE